METLRGPEAPPWFTGWMALIPCLLFGGIFLYYGVKYKEEHYEKAILDEDFPELFKMMPWWFSKVFYIILGLFILDIGFGYMVNVSEDFF